MTYSPATDFTSSPSVHVMSCIFPLVTAGYDLIVALLLVLLLSTLYLYYLWKQLNLQLKT